MYVAKWLIKYRVGTRKFTPANQSTCDRVRSGISKGRKTILEGHARTQPDTSVSLRASKFLFVIAVVSVSLEGKNVIYSRERKEDKAKSVSHRRNPVN